MARPPAGGAGRYTGPTHRSILDTVASNVRRLRAERGWTQGECAPRCGGMSIYQLHLLESGNANFTASALAQLCDGFGIAPAELFLPATPIARRRVGRPRNMPPAEPTTADARASGPVSEALEDELSPASSNTSSKDRALPSEVDRDPTKR